MDIDEISHSTEHLPTAEKPERIVNPAIVEAARWRDGVCLFGLILKDGCVPGFDVHHIDTRGSGGDDALTNLICLCRKHHNDAHEGRITKGSLRTTLHRFFGYSYSAEEIEEL
jgi:hypothetical protein